MIKSISEIYNVRISGKGNRPIVFAHGLGCDQSIWRYVAPAFEENFRVILFDYIGCGKSDISFYDENKHATLQGYAEDVLSICRDQQLEEVIFVGHSVSCMIGLLAANRHPGIFSRIVMLSPSPCYLNDYNYHGGFEKADLEQLLELMETNYVMWAGYLAPAVIGDINRPELVKEMTDRICTADHEITKKFARINFFCDHRIDLDSLCIPTLILQTAEDVLAPVEVGKFMKEKVKDSDLVMMRAKGHCPHLSAPHETITAIQNWLKEGNVK